MVDTILLDEFKFYNKQKIVIDEAIINSFEQKLKKGENRLRWTNNLFADNKMSFEFSKSDDENFIAMHSYYFKVTTKQIDNVKTIWNDYVFFNFNLTNNQEQVLEEIDYSSGAIQEELIIDDKLSRTFDNFEDFLILLIEKETFSFDITFNFYEGAEYEEQNKKDQTEILESLNFILKAVFNEEQMLELPKYTINYKHMRDSLYHIFKVVEKRYNNKNYRIAFITHIKTNSDFIFKVKVYSEDNEEYNYIDEKVLYVNDSDNNYYLDINLNEYNNIGSLRVDMNIFKILAKYISKVIGETDSRIITSNIFNFYKSKVSFFNNWDDEDIQDEKELKIIAKYLDLLRGGRTIKIEQVKINKTSISLDDDSFKIEFKESFFDVASNFLELRRLILRNDAKYNFNLLYEKILSLSMLQIIDRSNVKDDDYKEFEECSFKVNDMVINIDKGDNGRIRINDIFSRIDDVDDVLNRAICYNNVDDYNQYLKDVSYIGIDLKRMINNGIVIWLQNPLHSLFQLHGDTSLEKMQVRFSLFWDSEKRSRIYLHLNNKKYLIKKKGKFKTFFNKPVATVKISQLNVLLKECLEEWKPGQLLEVVENALEEFKIIKARGEKLVKETIEEINALKNNIIINGREINGFLLRGILTNKEYFIENENLDVYKKIDGVWNRRCVVSDPNKSRIYEDRLANRLINIYNENPNITTI